MSIFQAHRDELAAALEGLTSKGASVNVEKFVPDRLNAPALMITPGSPYVDRQDTDPIGSLTIHWEIWAIVKAGTNQQETTALDDLIQAAGVALATEGNPVELVDEPFIYSVQNTNLLAAVLHVSSTGSFT